MASKRESIAAEVVTRLRGAGLPVTRTDDAAAAVPAAGRIVVRDGAPSAPTDLFLGSAGYEWVLPISIEVYAVEPDRHSRIDTALMAIEAVLLADRTLGGLALDTDWRLETLVDLGDDGQATIRAAEVALAIRYFTTTPLGA